MKICEKGYGHWEYGKNVPSDLLGQEQKNLLGQLGVKLRNCVIFIEKKSNLAKKTKFDEGKVLGT